MDKVIVVSCVFIMLTLAGHFLLHMNDTVPTDGRTTFKTSAIGTTQSATVPYRTVMSVEWTFEDGKAISKDAYVENSTDNKNDVYFDVKLESGEVIYISPIVKVGTRLEGIALDKDLAAGEYTSVVTYHLLNTSNQETATAQIAIKIKIEK